VVCHLHPLCDHSSGNAISRKFLTGAEFYKAVFNWTFAASTLGFPAHKLQTFEVPGGIFPIGGVMRLAEEFPTGTGATKLYFYVNDIVTAMEVNDSWTDN
jgi:predicted enzyme related to lactoylglutathione lyase